MEYYNKIDAIYANALKSNVIYPVFKVELLDYNENAIADITQDISKSDSGSISINYQQGVRRSCSISLINVSQNLKIRSPKFHMNESGIWINTKFKVYTGIKIPNAQNEAHNIEYADAIPTGDTSKNLLSKQPENNENMIDYKSKTQKISYDCYWFSQGVYLLTDPVSSRDLSKKILTLSGVDKFGLFGSETNFQQTNTTYKILANSSLSDIVTSILNWDIGNGNKLDPVSPFVDPSLADEKLPFDIEKSPETYFADILTQLANIFACDIYYDVEGKLHVEKGNERQKGEGLPTTWEYLDTENQYYNPNLTYDFKSVYNCIKVVSTSEYFEPDTVGGDTYTYEYEAKNEDLTSPTRIQLIGRKDFYIESAFCYNLQRLKDFAGYLLAKKSQTPLTLSFQSSFIPHLDVNTAITITDQYFEFTRERFIIQNMTMPLTTSSLIDVEATNSANIPYFEF